MQGSQTTGTDNGVEAAVRHSDGRHVQHIFAEGWMMQGGGYLNRCTTMISCLSIMSEVPLA